MKKALSLVAQTVLFYVVFAVGFLLDPFKLKWFVSHPTPTSTRYFVPDGLIILVILYVAILGIEAARKRLLSSGAITSIAFVVALILGLMSKFGFATHDLF